MSDIPNRLPAPEKRKDKIKKNDMRYLYRINQADQRSKRRAVIDDEIDQEQKAAAKKRRQTVINVNKLAKTANRKAAGGKKRGRRNWTDEQLLLQASRDVCMGNCTIPCFFEDVPALVAPKHHEKKMTVEEILKADSAAIILNELDYGHLISHPKIWVFCAACHLGMQSTNIGKIQYFPSAAVIPAETGSRSSAALFRVPQTHRWLFYHLDCETRG